jgi:hypothetical protein
MARGQFSHTWAKHEFTAPGVLSAATCKRCGTETRKVTGPGRRRANITITEFKENPESAWTTERVLCKREPNESPESPETTEAPATPEPAETPDSNKTPEE